MVRDREDVRVVFDEASATYAKFGPFYIGIRLEPTALTKLF